jgi:hypothetical protein
MAQQVNLLNPALRQQEALPSFRGALLGWLAVALIAAVYGAWVGIDAARLEAAQADVAARVAAARSETQKLAEQVSGRQHDPAVAAEVARLEGEVEGRKEVMDALKAGTIGDTKGFSEHLRAFARQSFDGLWLTGLHIGRAGREMEVQGRALRADYVPGYLKRLNAEVVMQGHPFSDLVIQMPKTEPGEKEAAVPPFVEFRIATVPADKASGGAKP